MIYLFLISFSIRTMCSGLIPLRWRMGKERAPMILGITPHLCLSVGTLIWADKCITVHFLWEVLTWWHKNTYFYLPGDELYAGVATDLMGRDFTIFRSLGKRPSIRTEQHDSRWLNGLFVSGFLSFSNRKIIIGLNMLTLFLFVSIQQNQSSLGRFGSLRVKILTMTRSFSSSVRLQLKLRV